MLQVSLLVCGLSLLALTAVEGYHGYVTFTWVYGVFTGGYQYSLKMYVYQKVSTWFSSRVQNPSGASP